MSTFGGLNPVGKRDPHIIAADFTEFRIGAASINQSINQ